MKVVKAKDQYGPVLEIVENQKRQIAAHGGILPGQGGPGGAEAGGGTSTALAIAG